MNKVSRAIILDNKNRVLLGKRVRNKGVGKYALIGGRPEDNENAEQAIIREVKEELNINFKPQLYKEVIDKISEEKEPWYVSFFFGQIDVEPQPNPVEISDIIWVANSKLDNYDITFNHRDILKEFFNNQKNEQR